MSTQENKAIVRRTLEQKVNAGDFELYSEALSPTYVRHCQAMPPESRETHGPEAMKQLLRDNASTFPGCDEEIPLILGEGEVVAFMSRGTGTQKGSMGPLPATSKRMEVMVFCIHCFENDRIAETWVGWDNPAALRKLGHFPPPST